MNNWLTRALPIASIFSFRMLGLFMLIPVFTLYANNLVDATPTLIGLALGCYGLSQGLLQIPFGLLSDRLGRKPMITFGLILFAAGSLYGTLTHSIYGMIMARTLQGTGAIGSVLIALLADLTPNEHRVKAMAVIGVTIGVSFSLAMMLSPFIAQHLGLSGIFAITFSLALLGIVLLQRIPTPLQENFEGERSVKAGLLKTAFLNKKLQQFNLGIFSLHFTLTATFFVVPVLLKNQMQAGHLLQTWQFYWPLMLLAFIIMIPFIRLADKNYIQSVFRGAIVLLMGSQFALAFFYETWFSFCGLLLLYFVCFNILEATLPSLVSQEATPCNKGTAMGIYSSCQFLGIFMGGISAGIIFPQWGYSGIFMMNTLLVLGWLIIKNRLDHTPT